MSTVIEPVIVRRKIHADRARIFDAFSCSNSLSKWFSPSADISTEILTFQFEPQGKFRIRYTMPDGTCPVVGGTYETINKPTQIVFSWIWEIPDPHADIPTQVMVQLIDKGSWTEVIITHNRLPSSGDHIRYISGWEGTLDCLEQALTNNRL